MDIFRTALFAWLVLSLASAVAEPEKARPNPQAMTPITFFGGAKGGQDLGGIRFVRCAIQDPLSWPAVHNSVDSERVD